MAWHGPGLNEIVRWQRYFRLLREERTNAPDSVRQVQSSRPSGYLWSFWWWGVGISLSSAAGRSLCSTITSRACRAWHCSRGAAVLEARAEVGRRPAKPWPIDRGSKPFASCSGCCPSWRRLRGQPDRRSSIRSKRTAGRGARSSGWSLRLRWPRVLERGGGEEARSHLRPLRPRASSDSWWLTDGLLRRRTRRAAIEQWRRSSTGSFGLCHQHPR